MAEVLACAQELVDRGLAADVEGASRLVADDVAYWSHSGQRRTKDDLMRLVQQVGGSELSAAATEIVDPQVRDLGDVAVFTARIVDSGIKPGADRRWRLESAVTDVWARRDGRWQLVAVHETVLSEQE